MQVLKSIAGLVILILTNNSNHDVWANEEICNLGETVADDPSYTCVDESFNCPAVTVCPVVCMAEGEDCPIGCPVFTQLCKDGSCAEDCSSADELASMEDFTSPCPKCRPIIW